MNLKDAVKTFHEVFDPTLNAWGFQPIEGQESFLKTVGNIQWVVSFSVTRKKNLRVEVICGVGLRLLPIVGKLTFDEEPISHVGRPIHLLRNNKELKYWSIDTLGDFEVIRSSVIDDLTKYALPFFEKYPDAESVIRSLSSSEPKDWFSCQPLSRDSLLIRWAFSQAGKEKALALGEQTLKSYEGEPPAFRSRMERLVGELRAL